MIVRAGVPAVLLALLTALAPPSLAGEAPLFVPDPSSSTVPGTIFVVTPTRGGTEPDVDGANGPPYASPGPFQPWGSGVSNVIRIRDFAGSPYQNKAVHIAFPCDISLCSISPGPPYSTTYQQTVTCGPSGDVLHGRTDLAGDFMFVAYGAARDLGGSRALVGGGGMRSTVVTVEGFVGAFQTAGAAALDQNGAASPIFAGVTALDVVVALGVALRPPALRKLARADLNGDRDVTLLDVAFELGHVQRLAPVAPTSGCGASGASCPSHPCP